jgi:hypothetical protein
MSSNAERRRRWFQFGLGTLLTFTAGVGVGLFLAWSLYIEPKQPARPPATDAEQPPDTELINYLQANRAVNPACQGLLNNLGVGKSGFFDGKHLAFFSRYATAENEHRIVLVYDPNAKGNGFANGETIVITDADFQMIAWKELDGSGHTFETAELGYSRTRKPILGLARTRIGLGGGWVGTYRFSLADDDILQVGNVERPKPDYEEKLQEWLASPKQMKDLIRWIHANEGVVQVRKDGIEEELSAGEPIPPEPFAISVSFSHDDQQHPLDLTPLRGVSDIYQLFLQGAGIDDRVGPVLETLSQLETLHIDSTSLTGKGLRCMSGDYLPKLHTLELQGKWADHASLSRLGTLNSLEFVTLCLETLTDADVAALRGLDNLRFLDLSATRQVTCATLPVLPKLRAIWCSGGEISDDGARQFAKQPMLYTLRLESCESITDQGLESLGKAKSLTRLSIGGTRFTGEGFRGFSPDSPLRWISASGSEVTDRGVAAIARLKNLTQLGLARTHVTVEGVKHLATSSSLQRLDLSNTEIDDSAVAPLSSIKSLKHVSVHKTAMTEQAKIALEAAVSGLAVRKAGGLDEVFLSLEVDLGEPLDQPKE